MAKRKPKPKPKPRRKRTGNNRGKGMPTGNNWRDNGVPGTKGRHGTNKRKK